MVNEEELYLMIAKEQQEYADTETISRLLEVESLRYSRRLLEEEEARLR